MFRCQSEGNVKDSKSLMCPVVITKIRQLGSLTPMVVLVRFKPWLTTSRFIAGDIEESEILISKVVHEDNRYFLHKVRKGQPLSLVMKNKRKNTLPRLWTNSCIFSNWTCFDSSQIRKISAKIKWQIQKTPVGLHCTHKL